MRFPGFGFPVLLSCAAIAGAANAEVVELETRYEFEGGDGHVLILENLAGEVKVVGGSDDGVRVVATVVAEHADREAAEALARSVTIDVDEGRRRGAELRVLYPVDEHRRYIYEQRGTSYSTRTEYQGERIKVSSKGRSGVRIHANFEVSVPAGTRVRIENHFGLVDGANLKGEFAADTQTAAVRLSDSEGDARLDTGSGSVTVTRHLGEVRADTGSGSVRVTNVSGDVEADTGSGSIFIDAVKGDIEADTGSGSVEIEDVVSDSIFVDTGSGAVSLDRVSGSLRADTGSGGVVATDLIAGGNIDVDTGSGHIRLDGDLSAVRHMRLSAGSGGVTLRMSEVPSMRLSIDSGGGSIDLDVPGLRASRSSRGRVDAELGNGEGRGRIDTGSGNVRVVMK